jgi:hypothetical protein
VIHLSPLSHFTSSNLSTIYHGRLGGWEAIDSTTPLVLISTCQAGYWLQYIEEPGRIYNIFYEELSEKMCAIQKKRIQSSNQLDRWFHGFPYVEFDIAMTPPPFCGFTVLAFVSVFSPLPYFFVKSASP